MKQVGLLIIALSCPLLAHAESSPAAARGLAIVKDADKANAGFGGETSNMTMVLVNAHGDKTERKMSTRVLEGTDDGDKSIVTFLWPADVKDTRMLTWTHKAGNDDQWLYLPSLKRVKRISSRNKSGSFMGSEFAYEDLGSQEVEKYTYLYLRDEELAGRKTNVIQRTPVDKKSGYSKQVVWMDVGYKQALKIDFYDRKGDLLKTFHLKNYALHGKYWRPDAIEATNHQTRKRSILTWSGRKLGVAVNPDDFSKDSLEDW